MTNLIWQLRVWAAYLLMPKNTVIGSSGLMEAVSFGFEQTDK